MERYGSKSGETWYESGRSQVIITKGKDKQLICQTNQIGAKSLNTINSKLIAGLMNMEFFSATTIAIGESKTILDSCSGGILEDDINRSESIGFVLSIW